MAFARAGLPLRAEKPRSFPTYRVIFMNDSSTKEDKPSYTKLAMRNMVQKGGTSLQHFALTTFGLLAVLIGLAYLTH